jgi:hypothetical protein
MLGRLAVGSAAVPFRRDEPCAVPVFCRAPVSRFSDRCGRDLRDCRDALGPISRSAGGVRWGCSRRVRDVLGYPSTGGSSPV